MASADQYCDTLDELEEDKKVEMSSSDHTGVCVDMNSQTVATVTAPVLTGNNITGPVTIIYNTAGNEPQTLPETAEQDDLILKKFLETHKTNMKKKAERIFECNEENEAHLKTVYTELFITEGDMKDVNHEHEILKIDDAFKNKSTQDKPIKCNDIFTLLRGENEEKIVLTTGVAGIGKTVSVHKFILDWAEETANQDIDCVFLLPFREINLMTNEDFSLHELLLEFYPELEGLEKSKLYEKCKLAFIFDGLDESRLPLNFKSRTLNTAEKRSSVDVLFTSLVKGKLLPSALVWVTSRPAAANQIPPEYVGLFTDVRGFSDQQKEEYFRKRFTDETQASRIISHIKTSRSLYIMCHIPVFCRITATVLQNILKDITNNTENISTTLTEMYIHFLLIQMDMKNQKYNKKERERAKNLQSNREMILKLAKLAFEQLMKENFVFYEKDLKACGIDVSKDTELTGMIAEILMKEDGLYATKVFCFVHLSVQEFLAAVHVFLCYLNKNMQELQFFFEDSQTTPMQKLQFLLRNVTFHDLTKRATDKAMQSQRGHLDLFLRFLLGISLETSQDLLIGLFTRTEDTTESITITTEYIKQELHKDISDEASVNLFYCLLELKDHSIYEEIQSYLSSDAQSGRELSSSMCTVVTYVLMSEKVLDEFNPKRLTSSRAGCTKLPAVKCSRKTLFYSYGLDETCCEPVYSALQSSNSHLRELDLSSNHLDSGVKQLSDGLKSTRCQRNILRQMPPRERDLRERPLMEMPLRERPLRERPLMERPQREMPLMEMHPMERPPRERPPRGMPPREMPQMEMSQMEMSQMEMSQMEMSLMEMTLMERPLRERPPREMSPRVMPQMEMSLMERHPRERHLREMPPMERPPREMSPRERPPRGMSQRERPPRGMSPREMFQMEMSPRVMPQMEMSPMEMSLMERPPRERHPREMPPREMPLMEWPPRGMPPWEMSQMEMPPWEMSQMEMPPWEMSPMEMSPMEMSQMEMSLMEMSLMERHPRERHPRKRLPREMRQMEMSLMEMYLINH